MALLACKDAKAQVDDSTILNLQGVGAELLEEGGIDNGLLKATGKIAGGLGDALELKEGGSKVWDEILRGEDLTPNDMVPLVMPFMPIGAIANLGVTTLQNVDSIALVVSAGVDHLDPTPDAPTYLKTWEEDSRRKIAKDDALLAVRDAEGIAALRQMQQVSKAKSACGSTDWYNQSGTTDCTANEREPSRSGEAGWRQTSLIANYINPPPLSEGCFEEPKTIEAYTKLEAQEFTSSSGCTITKLAVIDTSNSVFTYTCQQNSQSPTSGSFEIYMTDAKIRTLRRELSTYLRETFEEETSYERCDLPPGIGALTDSAGGSAVKQ